METENQNIEKLVFYINPAGDKTRDLRDDTM